MTKTSYEKTHDRPQNPRAAVGYIRVSTKDQGSHGISLEAQEAGISAFAKRLGYKLIVVYNDVASAMGTKSVQSRPGLLKALDLVEQNDAFLIVYDWSRLSRDVSSLKDIDARIPDRRRILDAKSGTHLAEAAKAAVIAREEVIGREISRRTKEGMKKMKDEKGVTFGNPDIAAVQKKGAEAVKKKTLALDTEIARVLRSSGKALSSLTCSEAAEMLNHRGLLTGARKPWNKTRMRLPLTRLRKNLDLTENAAMKSNPLFGAF